MLLLAIELAFVAGNSCLFSQEAMELQKKRFDVRQLLLFSHGAMELGRHF